VLFEEFAAIGQPLFEVVEEEIRKADILIVLFGRRYSVNVRLEFEVARAQNIPTFVFVKETSNREQSLRDFLSHIASSVVFTSFDSSDELVDFVKSDVTQLLARMYRRFNLTALDFTESTFKQELEVSAKKLVPDEKLCFVIMPIGKEGTKEHKVFKTIFERLIKPAVELDEHGNPTGLRCERADQEIKTGNIPRDIIVKLATAEIVIADLTTRNSNVFYELGVRHALRQKTIMIAQSIDDLPFDVSNYRTLVYDPMIGFAEESIRDIRFTVKALITAKDIKDSPVLDWIV
jgi:hypothetical protein